MKTVCQFGKLALWGLFVLVQVASLSAQPQVIDRIRLIVNREVLTEAEIRDSIEALRQQVLAGMPAGPEREAQLAQIEPMVLESMINELLLLDKAKQLKLEVKPEEVDKQIQRIKQNNPEVAKHYRDEQMQEAIVKDQLKQQLIGIEVEAKINVSDQEIQVACQKNANPEQSVTLWQILFRGNISQAESKTQIIKQALAAGQSFGALAKQYSEDPKARQTGGKLGSFKRGQLLAAIDQAAFVLKAGEISELIQTEYGYHLLFAEAFEGGQSSSNCQSLNTDEKNRYSNEIYNQKREQALRDYVKELRKAAEIVIK